MSALKKIAEAVGGKVVEAKVSVNGSTFLEIADEALRQALEKIVKSSVKGVHARVTRALVETFSGHIDCTIEFYKTSGKEIVVELDAGRGTIDLTKNTDADDIHMKTLDYNGFTKPEQFSKFLTKIAPTIMKYLSK